MRERTTPLKLPWSHNEYDGQIENRKGDGIAKVYINEYGPHIAKRVNLHDELIEALTKARDIIFDCANYYALNEMGVVAVLHHGEANKLTRLLNKAKES